LSEFSDNRYHYNSALVANQHANKNKHAKLWKTSKTTKQKKQNKTKQNKTKQKVKDKINRDKKKREDKKITVR
jgi:hypothetical protein